MSQSLFCAPTPVLIRIRAMKLTHLTPRRIPLKASRLFSSFGDLIQSCCEVQSPFIACLILPSGASSCQSYNTCRRVGVCLAGMSADFNQWPCTSLPHWGKQSDPASMSIKASPTWDFGTTPVRGCRYYHKPYKRTLTLLVRPSLDLDKPHNSRKHRNQRTKPRNTGKPPVSRTPKP